MVVRWFVSLFPGRCSICDRQARWRSNSVNELHCDEMLCDDCLNTLAPEYR